MTLGLSGLDARGKPSKREWSPTSELAGTKSFPQSEAKSARASGVRRPSVFARTSCAKHCTSTAPFPTLTLSSFQYGMARTKKSLSSARTAQTGERGGGSGGSAALHTH